MKEIKFYLSNWIYEEEKKDKKDKSASVPAAKNSP